RRSASAARRTAPRRASARRGRRSAIPPACGWERVLSCGRLRIAFALEVAGELDVARAGDSAGLEHVHAVGADVLEQALVMGEEEHALAGCAHDPVDAFSDD